MKMVLVRRKLRVSTFFSMVFLTSDDAIAVESYYTGNHVVVPVSTISHSSIVRDDAVLKLYIYSLLHAPFLVEIAKVSQTWTARVSLSAL